MRQLQCLREKNVLAVKSCASHSLDQCHAKAFVHFTVGAKRSHREIYSMEELHLCGSIKFSVLYSSSTEHPYKLVVWLRQRPYVLLSVSVT